MWSRRRRSIIMSPAAGHQVHGIAIHFRELVPESARSPRLLEEEVHLQLINCTWSNAVEGLVVPQLAASADSGGDSFKRLLLLLFFQLLLQLSANADESKQEPWICWRWSVRSSSTLLYDHYNRLSRTAADENSHSNNYNYLSFSTKDIVSEFSRRLSFFSSSSSLNIFFSYYSTTIAESLRLDWTKSS